MGRRWFLAYESCSTLGKSEAKLGPAPESDLRELETLSGSPDDAAGAVEGRGLGVWGTAGSAARFGSACPNRTALPAPYPSPPTIPTAPAAPPATTPAMPATGAAPGAGSRGGASLSFCTTRWRFASAGSGMTSVDLWISDRRRRFRKAHRSLTDSTKLAHEPSFGGTRNINLSKFLALTTQPVTTPVHTDVSMYLSRFRIISMSPSRVPAPHRATSTDTSFTSGGIVLVVTVTRLLMSTSPPVIITTSLMVSPCAPMTCPGAYSTFLMTAQMVKICESFQLAKSLIDWIMFFFSFSSYCPR
mmetsp:Transcript_23055/g.61339  ORF Transcript_23055/g.61339 Transcript_23055/m.61339 type:complete len:302 (-) Transcript_23055:1762-2667(-)